MRKKIKKIYLDMAKGLIFVTEEGKEYAYRYHKDASWAINDINLVELPTKKEN